MIFAEVTARLRRAGIEVIDEPMPGYSRVYMSDPFGNRSRAYGAARARRPATSLRMTIRHQDSSAPRSRRTRTTPLSTMASSAACFAAMAATVSLQRKTHRQVRSVCEIDQYGRRLVRIARLIVVELVRGCGWRRRSIVQSAMCAALRESELEIQKIRAEVTGLDHGHMDPEWSELRVQCLRGPPRRTSSSGRCRSRDRSGIRRMEEMLKMRPDTGTHMGQHSAGHREQTEHVHSVDRPRFPALSPPRPLRPDRSRHCSAGRRWRRSVARRWRRPHEHGLVGDVELCGNGLRVVAQRLGHGGRIARGGDHVVAPLQGEGGHLRPESAGRAGDEPVFVKVGPSTAQCPSSSVPRAPGPRITQAGWRNNLHGSRDGTTSHDRRRPR